MTISSSVRVAGPYTGTGSVSIYPFAFKVFQASDVLVKQTDLSGNVTTLALTTDYSVALNSDQNANPGGSINLNSPLPNGYQLVISSQVQELQGTSLTNNGGFYPNVIENALDYLTILVQQAQTEINASLQVPLGGNAYDAGAKRIINLADGQNPADASTVEQMQAYANEVTAGVVGGYGFFQQAGPGAIAQTFQQKQRESVSLADYGADPTGNADIYGALTDAITYLASVGGGTIYGKGSDTYLLNTNLVITTSNITIDLRGGTLIGSGWLQFDGDSGNAGDWSKALYNVHFKNANIGNGSGSITKTPFFLYCIDSSMENVKRNSASTTGFNMFMCQRSRFVSCRSAGGITSSGQIGFLMLHCQQCSFVDCHATNGPFIFGLEIKGGYGNVMRDCSVRGIASAGSVVMQYGFMIRGDAPWSATGNGGLPYSYPYATGSWTIADPQRASWDCIAINCRVENCAFGLPSGQTAAAAFFAQEFFGGGFLDCVERSNTGSTIGFFVNRLVGGQENGFTVRGCKSYSQPGIGYVMQSQDTVVMPNILFADNLIDTNQSIGYLFTKVQGIVRHNQAYNACNGAVSGHQQAFEFTSGCDLDVLGNRSIDTRGTPLVVSGFTDDRTCNYNVFAGNDAGATSSGPITVWSTVGKFTDNYPGEIYAQTTSNVGNSGAELLSVPSGEARWVEATVRGVDTSGNVGAFKVGGLFVNNAGTLTQVGSTQNLMTAVNPQGWGGVTLSVVNNTIRVIVTGLASTTINWIGSLRLA